MEWSHRKHQGRGCPHCGSRNTAPILWGYPSAEGMAAANRGEAVLGGCVVGMDDPDFGCHNCGGSFWKDRRFQVERSGEVVDGVAVWPHGKRTVTVEMTDSGLLIAEPGRWSVLVPGNAVHAMMGVVFQEVWGDGYDGPLEWSRKRGIVVETKGDGDTIEIVDGQFEKVHLLGLKDWLRILGTDPFDRVLEELELGGIGFLASAREPFGSV